MTELFSSKESTNYLSSNKSKIVFILIVVALGLFILTNACSYKQPFTSVTEHLTNLFDAQPDTNPIKKLDQNKCSRQCCGQSQWQLPEALKSKDMTDEEAKNYVPSNFFCNLGSGSGCLCLTKDDFNYLASHGSNIQ